MRSRVLDGLRQRLIERNAHLRVGRCCGGYRASRCLDLRRQVSGGEGRIRFRHRNHPVDFVRELPDVPRPRIEDQVFQRFVAECQAALALLLGIASNVVLDQGRDFFTALAQRRHSQPDDVEAVEEVFAEASLRDQLLEIGVGRGDDADVHLDRMGLAERVDLVGLEKAEQLRLQVDRQIRDFVEKQRAPFRRADDAGEGGIGAGERAAAVAEQLALEHVARHRRAVEREHDLLGAVRGAMDRAGQHFLAGPGLAGEEDRQRRRADAAGDADDLRDRLGHPDAVRIAVQRFGRPQRGALLLLAAVAVQRQGGRDQLSDRHECAALLEIVGQRGDDLERLVPIGAAVDHGRGIRLLGGLQRLPLVPPACLDDPEGALRSRDQGHRVDAARVLEHREGLSGEDLRMCGELQQRHGAVEIRGSGTRRQRVGRTTRDFTQEVLIPRKRRYS